MRKKVKLLVTSVSLFLFICTVLFGRIEGVYADITTSENNPKILAKYTFDDNDGLMDSGLGVPPSIVFDEDKGNVMQFADGEASVYTKDTSNEKGEHRCDIVGGSPSSYEIINPYEGTNLTSMTYSFWVKVTDPNATAAGAGVLGWISAEYTADHPDARAGYKWQEEIGWYEAGQYIFGTNVALNNIMAAKEIAMINFDGLYHNWYSYWNEGKDLADSKWHQIIVTTDSSNANTKVYIDGEDLSIYGGRTDIGKRFNKGEKDYTNISNTLEPTLMEIVCMSGTKLYLGQTGTQPTSSGVYIDDLTFYDSIITDAEAFSIYNEEVLAFGNLGDVDNSGSIDAKDALLVLEHSAKLNILDINKNFVADTNKDDMIDATDALNILKYAAKLIDKFEDFNTTQKRNEEAKVQAEVLSLSNIEWTRDLLKDMLMEMYNYSDSEASYAIEHADINWKEMAVKHVNNLIDLYEKSEEIISDEVIETSLKQKGFTQEEINYALKNCK